MRKLIAIGLLLGGLLVMAGPAMAQQGGIGDPLTLAASGVLMPFFGDPGDTALLEVASPVADNAGVHMFFFDAHCNRVGDSLFLPLTENDIAHVQITGTGGFLDPGFFGAFPNNGGLITIANSNDGFKLDPLLAPVHSRTYVFSPSTGKSRIIEPIILDTFEYSGNPHTWSPLRTAVTFFAPPDGFGGNIFTRLHLICPKTTIQAVNSNGASYFDPALFPPPVPGLYNANSTAQDLRGVVFDTDEHPLVDIHTTCDCVRTTSHISDSGATGVSTIYKSAQAFASLGTFTKLTTDPVSPSSPFPFTGYRSTSSGPVNDFFGRMSNASYLTIDGRNPLGTASNTR